MEPYGLALLDYFNGDHSATQIFHRDDGRDFEVPISLFFRDSAGFSGIEQAAIKLCSGRVLDIGAGTGRHSLVLQEKGLDVIALDVRCTDDPVHLAYHERNRNENRFIGEIHFQIEYNGLRGAPFSWLQVDPETLSEASASTGWDSEIICQEPWGDYLARLSEC